MTSGFVRAFVLSFLATIASLGAVGAGLGSWMAPRPRPTFSTPVFSLRTVGEWRCDQDGGEFICRAGESTDAIGVFALKLRGAQDSMEAYRAHLSRPRRWKDDRGVDWVSEVRAMGTRRLAGHDWVAGTHYQSELPGFVTTYLATVTAYAGVLVTFSARESTYPRRAVELEEMVDSLVIYQTR